MRIVDLSRIVQGRMPTVRYQTHPTIRYTRLEAPAFMMRKGRTVDQLPTSTFMKSAVLLDVSGRTGEIDDEDLEGAEEGAGIAMREDEIAILHIGKESSKGRSTISGLSRNAVEYLRFKGIAGVGVDSHSIDARKTMLAHRMFLRRGIVIIEDLCNLGYIDQSRFHLLALPLRMRYATSPARVLALLR